MCSLAHVYEPPETGLPGIVQIHIALVQKQENPALMRQMTRSAPGPPPTPPTPPGSTANSE